MKTKDPMYKLLFTSSELINLDAIIREICIAKYDRIKDENSKSEIVTIEIMKDVRDIDREILIRNKRGNLYDYYILKSVALKAILASDVINGKEVPTLKLPVV